MANRNRREALRGAEKETCDLLAEVLTSEQWTEMLRVPLERAAATGKTGLARKLVGAGADIGDALHAAARGGHGGIVSDLLEHGAPVAAKDTYGRTPLHVAAREGKTEMVQLLLLKGADKDALNNFECTPLYLAALCGNVAAALALIAAGANISLRFGGSKRSVVHLAAQGGHVDIMRAAIERGADVDAVGTNKSTALHTAVRANKVEVIDVLVEVGANIEASNQSGSTPLHFAAGQPNLSALLALLKHGADVNALDHSRETPLQWAAGMAGIKAAAEVVDSLLRSGADETILNDKGEAAADVVGEEVEDEQTLHVVPEDVDRVRQLLTNAPADRAWRRRSYLVLCRAHPDRVQQMQSIGSAHAGMARRTRSGAKLGRAEASEGCSGAVEASPVDERGGGDWAVVVARVLGLQEEGIFRTIVGYL